MALRNRKEVGITRIYNEDDKRIARVVLVEEILSDNSKTYNVETEFYGDTVDPVLTLEDASEVGFNNANKKYTAIVQALSVFKESQSIWKEQ